MESRHIHLEIMETFMRPRKRQMIRCICLTFIAAGCAVKEVKDVPRSLGLDTLPNYAGSSAFSTREALVKMEESRVQADLRLSRSLQKRIAGDKVVTLQIFDPWSPPRTRSIEELPPALREFPKDKYGYPHWMQAVSKGYIKPMGNISSASVEEPAVFDEDILFQINDRLMANVLFPHRSHNYWLSCKVCHPGIFIDKRGANEFTMYDVWNGKYCGRCHGKVAFQPKGFENCRRCHSQKKKTMGLK